MFCWVGLVILYFIQLSNAVSVQVDGLIDLGPSWNYEYKIITPKPADKHADKRAYKFTNIDTYVEDKTKKKNRFVEDKTTKMDRYVEDEIHKGKSKYNTTHDKNTVIIQNKKENSVNGTKKRELDKLASKILEDFHNNKIYGKSRKIKDDPEIKFFTTHIFNQTMKVFKALRNKTSDFKVNKQIDFVARNYQEKFKEFVEDSKRHNIKSRLGTQKVILNTIDISNRILTRLVNFLIGDMDKKGILRNNLRAVNIFQKEVEKETKFEYDDACKKYGICRASKTFTDFLSEVMTIIIKTDDKQFKLAVDSFTEAFKNADFSKSLDHSTEKKLKNAMTQLEDFNIELLRAFLMISKNIINSKNRPLLIHNRVNSRINQTLALLELFDIFDKHMPNNESNTLEWNDLTKSFQQWVDGKRHDIVEIMENFVNLFRKTLESMDRKTQQKVRNILNMVL